MEDKKISGRIELTPYEKVLSGGDLRSIGKSNTLISKVKNQNDFDRLFHYLFHKDRIVVMRAADTIEKITRHNTQYLSKHKKKILELCCSATNIELQWHLAQLVSRLDLDRNELSKVWNILTKWAKDKTNSRIVRVNSVQALFELLRQDKNLLKDFTLTLHELETENIPSINARIKKLKKASHTPLEPQTH